MTKYLKHSINVPDFLDLPDGKKINFANPILSRPISPPWLGMVKKKRIKAKTRRQLDGKYIYEIVMNLGQFLSCSFEGTNYKLARKYAKLTLHYILEWLCMRDDRIIKDRSHNPRNYKLPKLLAKLYQRGPKQIRPHFYQLGFWIDKLVLTKKSKDDTLEEDMIKFQGVLLLFLHDIKEQAPALHALIDNMYPMETIPKQGIMIQTNRISNRPLPNLRRVHDELSTSAKPRCPICQKPYQKNRKGILWCRSCRYYMNYIEVGTRMDSYLGEPILIKIADFKRHGLILGGTGSGKTNTAIIIIYQLREHGYPCWVFECDKTHYRNLQNMNLRNPNASSSFWHFTPKNRKLNPFCINPLIPPKGYSLEEHIEHFGSVFEFAYELPLWVGSQFKQSLIKIFKDRLWDIQNDTLLSDDITDPYPLPLDLENAVKEILSTQYSEKVQRDVEGALLNRLRDFMRLSLGYLFNCRQNIPWSELVRRNVVFELQKMDARTQRFFICLMLTMLYEYFQVQGEKKDLQLLVIVEEASTVLSQELRGGEERSESGLSAEIIESLVSKSRAYGLGLLIMDQTPEKLPFRVRALPRTGIVHNLKNQDSVEMVYKIFREIGYLPKEKVGEALVVTPSLPYSRRSEIHEFPMKVIPDEVMRTHMTSFYEAYPWIKKPDPNIVEQIEGAYSLGPNHWIKEDMVVGLTPKDLKPQSLERPGEIDLYVAEVDYELFYENPIFKQRFDQLDGYSVKESIKRTIRERCRTKQAQTEIMTLKNRITKLNSQQLSQIGDYLRAVQPIIPSLVRWTPLEESSPLILPALGYLSRLVVFRYLEGSMKESGFVYSLVIKSLAEFLTENE